MQNAPGAFFRPSGYFKTAEKFLLAQVAAQEDLQQLVAIQLADQRACLPVVGDVGGVILKDVAHELIDGVIALLLQRGVHARQDVVDLLVLFLRGVEFAGIVFHSVSPPSTCQYTPIFCKVKGFWASVTKP